MVFEKSRSFLQNKERLTHASEMGKLFKVIFGHNLKIDNIKFYECFKKKIPQDPI